MTPWGCNHQNLEYGKLYRTTDPVSSKNGKKKKRWTYRLQILDLIPKAWPIKYKWINTDFTKIKNFCSVKGLVRGLATDWKKYLQTTYRIKNSQKRTIKLGGKSTIQLENEQKTQIDILLNKRCRRQICIWQDV